MKHDYNRRIQFELHLFIGSNEKLQSEHDLLPDGSFEMVLPGLVHHMEGLARQARLQHVLEQKVAIFRPLQQDHLVHERPG